MKLPVYDNKQPNTPLYSQKNDGEFSDIIFAAKVLLGFLAFPVILILIAIPVLLALAKIFG